MLKDIHLIIQKELGSIVSPVFFEVGMHYGDDTVHILPMLNNPRYYGFDQDPRNVDRLLQAPWIHKIDFRDFALGGKTDIADFYMSHSKDGDWSGSSSLKKPKEHLQHFSHITFDHTTIAVTTLDEFCAKHHVDHIDFLWTDIQGAELDLIRGGQQMLQYSVKFFYLEYYDNEMYEGQPKLTTIMDTLGPHWITYRKYPSEILLLNQQFTQLSIND
ncbi:MAG: FkbM family methyltransferase [Clostridia bacterium]|jgi:FkbM family methyltransferase